MKYKILKKNSTIQIISPSNSFKPISEIKNLAQKRLEDELEVKVTYSKNCMSLNKHNSSSIEERIEDIHNAFSNPDVDVILCATGGYNSNELLNHLDWNIIKNNPKPFIGSSDITVLINAIFKKTGNITYYGPNFFKFGMKHGLEYTLDYFKKSFIKDEPYDIVPSPKWSNDKWYKNQEKRKFIKNSGPIIINEGKAEGTIIGGNLCSLNLLQGTAFIPKFNNTILFIEDDDLAGEHTFGEFNRNLQSLLQLPNSNEIKAIVIGRFQPTSQMTQEKIASFFKTKKELNSIPIIANIDFGHTDPSITFPIGGKVKIIATTDKAKIVFL